LNQIAEWCTREFVACKIRDQAFTAVDNCGVERVVHEGFVGKVVFIK
jgi:hypothetical protein